MAHLKNTKDMNRFTRQFEFGIPTNGDVMLDKTSLKRPK